MAVSEKWCKRLPLLCNSSNPHRRSLMLQGPVVQTHTSATRPRMIGCKCRRLSPLLCHLASNNSNSSPSRSRLSNHLVRHNLSSRCRNCHSRVSSSSRCRLRMVMLLSLHSSIICRSSHPMPLLPCPSIQLCLQRISRRLPLLLSPLPSS
jgi:hypothetical protein